MLGGNEVLTNNKKRLQADTQITPTSALSISLEGGVGASVRPPG